MRPTISAIIPCLNEEVNVAGLLRVLRTAQASWGGALETIVVDGGSRDATVAVAESFAGVRVERAAARRSVQMARGVAVSRGELLYFLHADARPPLDCLTRIASAVAAGHPLGGYAFAFDSASTLLRFNSWLTGFNVLSFRGGDQTIFMARALYERLGGFRESMVIMEEYDLLRRAREAGVDYHLLDGRTLVSARKYDGTSWARVQVANVRAMAMWRRGSDSREIRDAYYRMLGLR